MEFQASLGHTFEPGVEMETYPLAPLLWWAMMWAWHTQTLLTSQEALQK